MLSERQINMKLVEFLNDTHFTLAEIRIPPEELDIIAFNPESKILINFEIKRHNWRWLLTQAVRGQQFCHLSIAVLPERMRSKIPVEEFSSRGIGLMFYHEVEGNLTFSWHSCPENTNNANRGFKRKLYQLFCKRYGDEIYA